MRKDQLKVFELLGDLVDKKLKIGCIISFTDGDGSGMIRGYYTVCGDSCMMTDTHQGSHGYFYITKGYDFIKKIHKGYGYKKIGQYHLGTILQWINENREGIYGCDGKSLQCWNEGEIGPDIDIQFEGKPPIERNEQQNKELIEFMESVKSVR